MMEYLDIYQWLDENFHLDLICDSVILNRRIKDLISPLYDLQLAIKKSSRYSLTLCRCNILKLLDVEL